MIKVWDAFIIPERALGVIVIFPAMLGIFLTNSITEPSGLPVALILIAVSIWITYDNREKYLPMIR